MQAYNDSLKKYMPRRRASREDPLDAITVQAKQTEFLNRAIKILDRHTRQEPAPTPEALATRFVVEHFSLGPVTAAVLELARSYAYIRRAMVESLWDALRDVAGGNPETTALLLNYTSNEVIDALYELADRGIVCFDYDREYYTIREITPGDHIISLFARVWHPAVRRAAHRAVRSVIGPRRYRHGGIGGPDGRVGPAPVRALLERAAGHGQDRVCAPHRRADGGRYPAQASV